MLKQNIFFYLCCKNRQNIVKNYGCPSCFDHYDTIDELGNHLGGKHTPKARPEVDTSFKNLKNENNWTFSTGTVVENQLYEFGKLQIEDHPSQSFIFDVNDSEQYIKHETFTCGEIEEIMIKHENIPLQLPDNFKQYLNKFNCKSTVDIRKSIESKKKAGKTVTIKISISI